PWEHRPSFATLLTGRPFLSGRAVQTCDALGQMAHKFCGFCIKTQDSKQTARQQIDLRSDLRKFSSCFRLIHGEGSSSRSKNRACMASLIEPATDRH
ncbi:hypothetical protein, partial [Bradyrhizobium canariense]|uniref:hypothetical protein n=1 Tax=Bradyrhizobium canariense TaxID=255045 RepID=UPI001CA59D9D